MSSDAEPLTSRRLGFAPELLTGLELLPERYAQARRVLPAATTVWQGDASEAPVEAGSRTALPFRVASMFQGGPIRIQSRVELKWTVRPCSSIPS